MYQTQGRVAFSQINERGYLSMVGILDYLQDCCTFHSEDVGFRVEDLVRAHRGWFVTSWQIKVHDLPKHGEYITVRTIPTQARGMIGERFFTIDAAEGDHCYIEAKSLWVFVLVVGT